MGDDGIGLAVLARLQERWQVPAGVELVDGGTWGMNLLPVIEDAGRVLLIDAINTNAPPGSLQRLSREQLPKYLATKISPHQVDLHDVLALAELRRTLPDDTMALGVQPERVEMIVELTPAVAQAVEGAVAQVVAQLEAWGHTLEPQAAPAAACTS
jgi:hydrogenase maturation protease